MIRDFVAEAERRGIEYNIVEAFDQTWKTNEGSVGAYWGLFDADRVAKFPLTGVVENHGVLGKAAAGLAIGFLLTAIGLRYRRPTLSHALVFAVCANALGFGIAAALAYPVRELHELRHRRHVGRGRPDAAAADPGHPDQGARDWPRCCSAVARCA